MKHILSLVRVALFVFAARPFAQTNVAGNWELTINGPQGTINSGLTLKQDGEKLTGTFSGPQGEVAASGTVKGNTVSLAFNVDTPNGALSITMNGEVADGKSIKGVLDFTMGTADFTGTKK